MTDDNGNEGHGRRLCGARRRQGTGTCRRPAGWGTPTPGTGPCRLHGGNTRNHRVKAEIEVAEQAVRKLAAPGRSLGHPVEELLKLATEVIDWKERISLRVQQLGDLTIGDLAQVRGEVVLFERALDRCTTVLGAIAKLNLDERLVKLSERQGVLTAWVVSKVLAEHGLPVDDSAVRASVAAALREVATRDRIGGPR